MDKDRLFTGWKGEGERGAVKQNQRSEEPNEELRWVLAQQIVKMWNTLPRDVWKLKGLVGLFFNTSSGGGGANDWGKRSSEL